MSRIGILPINIPEGVEVNIDKEKVTVKWPKGELSYEYPTGVSIEKNDNEIKVSIESDDYKALWGMSRTIVANMVYWVTEGYEKKLIIIWVWYNARVEGQKVILNLWYSHPIEYDLPEEIQATVDKDSQWNPLLTISWIDKQLVWQVAAKIRSFRTPEPYKGKGIRYEWEKVKMKVGKSGK